MKKSLTGLVALSLCAGSLFSSCKNNKLQDKNIDLSEYSIQFKDSAMPYVWKVSYYPESEYYPCLESIEENVEGPVYFVDYNFELNKLSEVNSGVFAYEDNSTVYDDRVRKEIFRVKINQNGEIRYIMKEDKIVDDSISKNFAEELVTKGNRYKAIVDSLNSK